MRHQHFSSDLVFDGERDRPYLESDPTAPLGVYGQSKAEAERRVLDAHPQALVVRSSAFFGQWDAHNFVHQALTALERGEHVVAASNLTVSPTYVPDLVNTCLDLLIDHERGIWHLANDTAVSWAQLAVMAAQAAGVDPARLEARPVPRQAPGAIRPVYSALGSERAVLMPPLADALERFAEARGGVRAEYGTAMRAV
ncbi:MAG: sugar nucleotide-binding protein [Massilia sp.]